MGDDVHMVDVTGQQTARLRGGWVEARGEGSYVLARQWPPRFDVAATSEFPPMRASRLARQIRQDLWRALQNLRGFSPVVQIVFTEHGLTVTAGGRLSGKMSPGLESRIQAVLDDPDLRSRWSKWARVSQ